MNYQQMCDNIKAGTMTAADLSEAFGNIEFVGYSIGFTKGYEQGYSDGRYPYEDDSERFATVEELMNDLEKD